MKTLGYDGLFCAGCGGMFAPPNHKATGSPRLCAQCVEHGVTFRADGTVRMHFNGEMQFVSQAALERSGAIIIAIAELAKKGLIYRGVLPRPKGGPHKQVFDK